MLIRVELGQNKHLAWVTQTHGLLVMVAVVVVALVVVAIVVVALIIIE